MRRTTFAVTASYPLYEDQHLARCKLSLQAITKNIPQLSKLRANPDERWMNAPSCYISNDASVSGIETESLYSIGSSLETALGKLQALSAVFGRLADAEDDDALMFFSFMYSLDAIREEANGVFHRLHARACAERHAVQAVGGQ